MVGDDGQMEIKDDVIPLYFGAFMYIKTTEVEVLDSSWPIFIDNMDTTTQSLLFHVFHMLKNEAEGCNTKP